MQPADYASARRAMVENQIQASSVTDVRLIRAFHKIPREHFVPKDRRALAYSDAPHPLGNGRILPAPAVFARLVQLADIKDSDRVLDYGAASGYSTAILAGIAGEVVGVEPDSALAAVAQAALAELGLANATIIAGDEITPDLNTFDAIIVEGALTRPPSALLARLALGGRLVCLLRQGPTAVATVFTSLPEGVVARSWFNATLPPIDPEPATETFVF